MRIIAGQWRSRRIEWPATGRTRPITDRIKESVFDMLGSRFGTPGTLPPIVVADVFAGGGSLGLEALSRGARRAYFYDRDRTAIAVIRRNLDHLKAGPEAVVISLDVWRTGLRFPVDEAPLDLVFLDPPFADLADASPQSKLARLLARLDDDRIVDREALIVLRHGARVHLHQAPSAAWIVDDQREIGESTVTFLLRRPPANPSNPQDLNYS